MEASKAWGIQDRLPELLPLPAVQPKAIRASPATPAHGELSDLRVMKLQPSLHLLSLVVNAEQA